MNKHGVFLSTMSNRNNIIVAVAPLEFALLALQQIPEKLLSKIVCKMQKSDVIATNGGQTS